MIPAVFYLQKDNKNKKGVAIIMVYNFKLIKKIIISFLVLVAIIVIQLFFGISYVPTNSMEPFIMKESLVLSQKTSFTPKVGDICIYNNSSNVKIIHRIVDIKTENGEKKYQFKGDNNKKTDTELVSASQIKAKYIAHSHLLGIAYKYIKGLLAIVCTILGIYFIYQDNKNNTEDPSIDANGLLDD